MSDPIAAKPATNPAWVPALPVAWTLIAPAAALYRLLPDDLREEAEGRWGPITGTDPHDFSPIWCRHFPSKRLVAIDDNLKALDQRRSAA